MLDAAHLCSRFPASTQDPKLPTPFQKFAFFEYLHISSSFPSYFYIYVLHLRSQSNGYFQALRQTDFSMISKAPEINSHQWGKVGE